jgi:superfamily II DNA or RNA helicase
LDAGVPEQELERLRVENARLRAENSRLCAELQQREIERSAPRASRGAAVQLRLPLDEPPPVPVTKSSPLAERIALFRALFRGRTDVWARRWEGSDGRAGYAPSALTAEQRQRRAYLPLTDGVIERHLAGEWTCGIYPLLADETCRLLAVDFDGTGWEDGVAAYLAACAERDVPVALERSRSGDGAHVWTFFTEPVQAARARRLGESLLTRAMALSAGIGMDAYDRLFPNQDTLPHGGLGNLIALPLQRVPARKGNSLFIDPTTLVPFPDQWVFLSQVRRMPARRLESLVRAAERAGAVLAVTPAESTGPGATHSPPEAPVSGPLPASARLTLANLVYVDREGMPAGLVQRIWRLAAYPNPEFQRRQAQRFSTFGIPRVVHLAEEDGQRIGLPRGLEGAVRDLLGAHGIAVDVADARCGGTPLKVTFHGELTAVQQRAAEAVLSSECGVLCGPTAFGKTVVAASVIAARSVNTLVLVHRQILADQWRARLAAFLDLPPKDIGQVGAGRRRLSGGVDIALVQSLARREGGARLTAAYGQIIVDECHHVPAQAFEPVLRAASPRFVLGLTATPIRRDGQHPVMTMQCGPIRFRADPRDPDVAPPFSQVVVTRVTPFRCARTGDDSSPPIQRLYADLAADDGRNALIVSDIRELVASGRSPLVLTERVAHLEALAGRLADVIPHIVVLRGGAGTHRRRAAIEALDGVPPDVPCVVLATGRYIGEGFDDARPDTLLLTTPVSWPGTVWQYAGRIGRPRPGKDEVRIYDYADLEVPVLERMYRKRLRAYRALGYVATTAP